MIVIGVTALAAVGTLTRWQAGRLLNAALPLGTLLVNLVGSFALGLLAGRAATTLTVIGIGLLGSLTTFSTLMVEAETMGRSSRHGAAVGYLALTVVGGIGAALVGLELA